MCSTRAIERFREGYITVEQFSIDINVLDGSEVLSTDLKLLDGRVRAQKSRKRTLSKPDTHR